MNVPNTGQVIYDLIIIGGGILGAATARDAALRGHRVLLLEKGYYSLGASAKTSKLAHGGLRYLEQGAFALVKESIDERNLLLHTAQNRVKPLPFIIPIFEDSHRPFWQLRLGLWFYSFFSRKGPMPKHRVLSKQELNSLCPGLDTRKLKGAAVYYDAQMQDLALTIDVIADAQAHGAICKAHHKVTTVTSNPETGHCQVEGEADDRPFCFYGKHVLYASGPWSNRLLQDSLGDAEPVVRPSKGSHIVIKQTLCDTAITLTTPQDQRVFFMIPYQGHTLVGTTEEDFSGDPDQVTISEHEITYLLDAINHHFPNISVTKTDIIQQFSGLRPLSVSTQVLATQASRELRITQHQPHVYSVVGGKYTTFRAIGEQVVSTVLKSKKVAGAKAIIPPNAYPLKQFILDRAGLLKVGHRGHTYPSGDDQSKLAENTIAAFDRALEIGCNMLECDLQLSADGTVFIFHDDTGERLLKDTVDLRTCTADHLQALPFKDHPDSNIPFLHDFLSRYKGKTYFYLEIKKAENGRADAHQNEIDCLHKTHEQVVAHDLTEQVFYASFSPELLIYASQQPKLKDMCFAWNLDSRECFEQYKDVIREFTMILCPDKALFSPDELKKLIAEGWRVCPYTFKDPADFSLVEGVGVSGFTSDVLIP